ncbi:hypothetical protein BY458DRAFT_213446 [Sporodiniella umbellata]|nr:hypothetical protein BY458DRAFT_213446 [Sporodiniella umbellata]
MEPPLIELVVQPPSPKPHKGHHLPPINTMCTLSLDDMSQQLPTVCVDDHSVHQDSHHHQQKLNILEPSPCLSASLTPNSPSSHMGLSSPALSSVSAMSPLISPISDSLLAPPDFSYRRCRSASNTSPSASSSPSSSPSHSPAYQYRSLSEPPEQEKPTQPLFAPKRKRGRPPNASRPETQDHWTFIQPTVWDVKNNRATSDNEKLEPTTASDSSRISTFTSTNMDMTLSIPKKKRGRKPKNQLAGNSCFVWKDLTAPRGANKKKAIRLPERSLLPAIQPPPPPHHPSL